MKKQNVASLPWRHRRTSPRDAFEEQMTFFYCQHCGVRGD
ncbi:unnamed protein product [Brassica oleracea var. botrytis]|uniref:(rape) hypothetical protein n=1 Tax=Brassica napus TaxID=3708 RepID=A0A816JE56_BRANA|nr:unnamed protein product [Brassica napus]